MWNLSYKIIKLDIQYIIENKKKLTIIEKYLAYLNHIKQEYDYYNINIKNVVKDGKRNSNIIRSQILFKLFENSIYIIYD